MERLPSPAPRETTDAMVVNIGRELAEIEQAICRCRGDALGEPRITGCWMAHLLISSQALLHNLLIDTARPPKRIESDHPNAVALFKPKAQIEPRKPDARFS